MDHGRDYTKLHKPICVCGKQGVLNEEFDAYYCPIGMVWLEPKCLDDDCEYCSKRPETPKGE